MVLAIYCFIYCVLHMVWFELPYWLYNELYTDLATLVILFVSFGLTIPMSVAVWVLEDWWEDRAWRREYADTR